MSLSKAKRKVDDQHRQFQEKWEMDYCFVEFRRNGACFICKEKFAVLKEYNLKWHYCMQRSTRKKVRPEPVPEVAIPRPQRVRPILRRLRKFLKKEQALVAEGSVREPQTTGSEVTPHIPSEVSAIPITPSPNALQETEKEETKVIKAILHEDPVKMEDLEGEEETNSSLVPAVLGPSSSSLERCVTQLMGQEVAKRGRSSRGRSPSAALTAPDNSVALLQPQQLKCRGLPNLGHTCYLNATLQCLLHLQPLCTQLLVQEEVWRMEPKALLLGSFVGLVLLRGSFEMDMKAAVLLELKDQISLHNQEFEGNSQNDAHEFLSECLLRLRVIGQALAMGDMAYQCPVDTLLSFQLRYIRTCQRSVLFIKKELTHKYKFPENCVPQ
ncbi:ubiquitin carboxyl-terminal hydrolase 37-like [Clupea harengus]|uniref:Ubiquitin carboxyl-terminal hydrolase 37-like n=1 Tax=Clupea harengus TaxID=7950 RepID=A0A8M1KDN1_CLUHA|nr:ubiquitin carboxyl-terminal hydrolase 37-like [Clupea harengus]